MDSNQDMSDALQEVANTTGTNTDAMPADDAMDGDQPMFLAESDVRTHCC